LMLYCIIMPPPNCNRLFFIADAAPALQTYRVDPLYIRTLDLRFEPRPSFQPVTCRCAAFCEANLSSPRLFRQSCSLIANLCVSARTGWCHCRACHLCRT
jgi:hypothetical protein